jgi:chromate transporter
VDGLEYREVPLATIAREWLRIGCIGFGGPPAHIALFRRRCVEERGWVSPEDFEDAVATTNLLPGPASTQLAIFCAWRLRSSIGAIVGGLGFICPGLVVIIALSAVLLGEHPPLWVLGAAAGGGAGVPAVALNAAWGFVPASLRRAGDRPGARSRWAVYAVLGATAAVEIGPFLVLVLLACGICEMLIRTPVTRRPLLGNTLVVGASHLIASGGLGALCFVAFKVGALSYGGGFVIIPLMQHDAVSTYHFMTGAQFLDAVALGQITPGPVVLTVAVVGYAARGVAGALIAAAIAFAPSFAFIIFGGPHFNRIRTNVRIQAFFSGAGPAVIGAIAGSAISLGLALSHYWQIPVLAGALIWLFVLRKGVVSALLVSAFIGVLLALAHVAL